MPTTQLFIELLVIGAGAVLWVGLGLATLCGIDVTQDMSSWRGAEMLPPLLIAAYVLGILLDRLVDWGLDKRDKELREEYFKDSKLFFVARRKLIVFAPSLWNYIEYGRSRLRICRGWLVNFAACAVMLWVHDLCAPGTLIPGTWPRVVASLLLLGLAVVCYQAWYHLTDKEYLKIQRQAAWIEGGGLDSPKSLDIDPHLAPDESASASFDPSASPAEKNTKKDATP